MSHSLVQIPMTRQHYRLNVPNPAVQPQVRVHGHGIPVQMRPPAADQGGIQGLNMQGLMHAYIPPAFVPIQPAFGQFRAPYQAPHPIPGQIPGPIPGPIQAHNQTPGIQAQGQIQGQVQGQMHGQIQGQILAHNRQWPFG